MSMKLDRNINPDGKGKYALVKLRGDLSDDTKYALSLLEDDGRLDWGNVHSESEFWVFKLKDKYSAAGLAAYADAAERDDPEFAAEVREMLSRAGPNSPWCKRPD
jgi:hypothetical protein